MSTTVDVRGLSCPQPVILTQKAIDKGEFPFEVVVDTVTARENVLRLAERKGFKVEVTQQDDEFRMVISK
jgi:TusA-related sulfurtransferase